MPRVVRFPAGRLVREPAGPGVRGGPVGPFVRVPPSTVVRGGPAGPVVSGGREGSVGRFVRVNAGPVVRGARVPPSPVVVSTLLRVAAVFVFAVVLAIVLRGGSVRAGNFFAVVPRD